MLHKKQGGPAMLSCRHLTKSYGELQVIKDATFSIRKGERVGIVGPNGSGKTTLLKMLALETEPDSGTLHYFKNAPRAYFPQVHGAEELSGGELARKVLLPIMESGAEVFLLDEPTNNLDLDGLDMLEKFVQKSDKTFLIISHDRMFLDRTVGKIIEMDPYIKKAVVYDGNYSAYLEEKEAAIERQWNAYSDSIEKKRKLGNEVEERLIGMRKLENLRKSVRNMPIHEKEKPVAAIIRDKEGSAGRRARILKDRLMHHIEESETITKPVHELPLVIEFSQSRGSTNVFDLVAMTKRMGSKMLGPIDASIKHGDRIHVTGKNGAGKTTLLRILVGELAADSGEAVRGRDVRIGYMRQSRHEHLADATVVEDFLEHTKLEESFARKILYRFRLTAEDVKKKLKELSPGEYSRLIVAKLLALQPNCIILDEPTNHLDLEVLEELERGLATFDGTLIVASHDRYFVERVRLTRELKLSE